MQIERIERFQLEEAAVAGAFEMLIGVRTCSVTGIYQPAQPTMAFLAHPQLLVFVALLAEGQ